jgi:uncharacterized membrane protein (DUF485 family)
MLERSRVYDLVFAVVAVAAFACVAFVVVGPHSEVRSVFYCCLTLVPVAVVLQRVWPALALDVRGVKRLLIVGIVGSAAVTGLLIPPFQGPDEIAHWKLALSMYRVNAMHEWQAYSLPEILGAYALIFRPDIHLDSRNLRRVPEGFTPDMKPQDRKHYSYVRPHSYPVVAFVSSFFPRVHSLRQALLFFYICRFVPIALLGVMLLLLNRHLELPYAALFFFSLPLVLQQFTVVSPDTFLNLGTAAAAAIYIRLLDRPSLTWLAALWTLALLLVASKFTVAAVLLLPLSVTPLGALRAHRKSAIIGALLLVAIGIIALPHLVGGVLQAVRDTGVVRQRLPEVEAQIVAVQSWGGLHMFARGYWKLLRELGHVSAWSGPLGWLDAELDDHHVALIATFGLLAVLLDMERFGPRLVELVRRRWRRTLAFTGIILASAFSITLLNAFLFYLMASPVASDVILSTQVRHYFPAAILAFVLAAALLRDAAPPADEPRPRWPRLAETWAVVGLSLLLVARTTELAADLLVRYW